MSVSFDQANLVDVEVFSNNTIRAVEGKVSSGRIVRVNDLDVDSTKISHNDIVQMIKSANIKTITVTTEPKLNSSEDSITNDYVKSAFCFVQLPDGCVGLTVAANSSQKINNTLCVQGLSVVDKRDSIFDLSVGDVIVSVNGISLVGLSCDAAVGILRSVPQRNVTVMKACQIVQSRNIEKPPTVDEYMAELNKSIHAGTTVNNVSQSFATTDSEDSASNVNSRKEACAAALSTEDIARQWKSIRSNLLVKRSQSQQKLSTGSSTRMSESFETSNALLGAVQEYSYSSELRRALHFGNSEAFSETVRQVRRKVLIKK